MMDPDEIDKVYQPHLIEKKWLQLWLDKNYFHATSTLTPKGKAYSIVIPPPNITGSLHLGHALNITLQDILVRRKRMQGYYTLWLPGTDHAGIATQNVVERQLFSEGTSRESLGRAPFVERIWRWREESGRTIVHQLKQLGASCDWSRERFTLDEGLSKAVRKVFVELYKKGLIYRGERLINWCPRCQTALSDIEVEHEEIKGKMYTIQYPLVDRKESEPEYLMVATTRPETMLGDTAVAVHPEDPRYKQLIGRQISLPLTHREIPIVGDSILVDRAFGTGAVKITPGHDFNDAQAGQRHGLPTISILDEKGRIRAFLDKEGVDKEVLEDIALMDVPKAREQVVRWLEQRDYLVKIEDHHHAIGKCYRCRSVVEPYLSPQWFVKVNDPEHSLVRPAIEAVRKGEIQLVPESWKPNFFGWMENIQDWCISRQIWWGHQIPAWYCLKCNSDSFLHRDPDGTPLIGKDAKPIVSEGSPARCPDCKGTDLIRDPDVLDTWFSSALWPFSTLGWPEETQDLKTFYPTAVLVTSFDILFFWVARMIMMGLEFRQEVPFRHVYIHALVKDAEGKKMSKSKGNVIDPLRVMEKHGTDALRFTMAAMASPGRDIKLSEQRIEGYRNFANKIWNAARFVQLNLRDKAPHLDSSSLSLADRWISIRLQRCIDSVNTNLDAYRFDEAANQLYRFIWHEYCDWYLELIKPRLNSEGLEAEASRGVMVNTLEVLLRLLHPFMPFITEEIWQKLPHEGESIVVSQFPESRSLSLEEEATEGVMEDIISIIKEIRSIRSTLNIPPIERLHAGLKINQKDFGDMIVKQGVSDIQRLAGLSIFDIGFDISIPAKSLPWATSAGKGFVVVDDSYLRKEQSRVARKLVNKKAEFERENKKWNDKAFQEKAPKEVKESNGIRRNALDEEINTLSQHLSRVNNLLGE